LTRFQTAEYDGLSRQPLPFQNYFANSKIYFMVAKHFKLLLCVLGAWLAFPVIAEAQAPLGARAAGLAGAFVGVADDASAVYWNPAGLATGAIVSVLVSFGDGETVQDDLQAPAAERLTGTMVAFSLPPVGLAYYRIGAYGTTIDPPAVNGSPSREEVRRNVQALTTSTVAVSLLQSLTDHIVVGVTPKVVRGTAAFGVSGALRAEDALDAAADLDGPGETAFDVDAAVMIAVERIRLGFVARNLTTPEFASTTAGEPGDGGAIELQREMRAGVAWGSQWPGNSRVTVSVDADLTARVTPFGDRRDVAAGVETLSSSRRLAVRGGARRSTTGAARGAVTGGASYAVRPSIFVEGHVAFGEWSERGWSVGVRAGF
jgi:hypothetical protein